MIGAIVCKIDTHKRTLRSRGYIAMLAVDNAYRRKKIGKSSAVFTRVSILNKVLSEFLRAIFLTGLLLCRMPEPSPGFNFRVVIG